MFFRKITLFIYTFGILLLVFMVSCSLSSQKSGDSSGNNLDKGKIVVHLNTGESSPTRGSIVIISNRVVSVNLTLTGPSGGIQSAAWVPGNSSDITFYAVQFGNYTITEQETDESGHSCTSSASFDFEGGVNYTVTINVGGTITIQIDGGASNSSQNNSGYSWHQAASSTVFSPRCFFGFLPFHNKLWVIAGIDQEGTHNCSDIYQSPDGTNWTMVSENAVFGKRQSAAYTIFKNCIWMTGGAKDWALNHDVWYSEDGENWHEANGNAPFGDRMLQGMVAFNGAMWLIAGRQDVWGSYYANDVWMSQDGTNWSLATANAGFSPRQAQSALVFNGAIWLLGGHYERTMYSEAWFSTNGTNWQKACDTPFSGRDMCSSVVYDHKIWTIGGYDYSTVYKEIWNTSDGTNWNLVTSEAPFGRIFGDVLCEFNGNLWMAGGYNGAYLNSVWYMK